MTKAADIDAAEDAIARANKEMRRNVLMTLGPCDATNLLAWMIDTHGWKPCKAYRSDLTEGRFNRRWQLAGCPGMPRLRRAIVLHRLRAALDVPLPIARAAILVGLPSRQSAHQMVRRQCGLGCADWSVTHTSADTLAAFTALIARHEPQLVAFRLPADLTTYRAERRARLERRILQLDEERQRVVRELKRLTRVAA